MIGKYEIVDVRARQIIDSRGNPTIECEIQTGKGFGQASVPSGASVGIHEAKELRDGGKAFGGKGVLKAIANIQQIKEKIKGMDARDQEGIDNTMKFLDGTPDFSVLGANATLAVSITAVKAAASSRDTKLYDQIRVIFQNEKLIIPVPAFNLINGGIHAGNDLAIQEFMIMPIGAKTFAEALQIGVETYHELGKYLKKKYGPSAVNLGDEGGYAPPMSKSAEALDALDAAVKAAGYEGKVIYALDCAASQFFKSGKYEIDGKKLAAASLSKYYQELIQNYPIQSIEDPFEEEDFESFVAFKQAVDIQVVGDDLLCTNYDRVKKSIQSGGATNAMLVKLNQAGTITEAKHAMDMAKQGKMVLMLSHRSGETNDSFIADLAIGIGLKQVKFGAPARGERVAKYNRLLKIEEATNAPYAGEGWRD